MNQEQKIYAPVSAKEVTFQSGKTIIKLGVNVAKFTEFLKQHANAKGYVNLGISSRKEVSQYGETHTVWLDTWKPESNQKPAPQKESPRQPAGGDDVPFN